MARADEPLATGTARGASLEADRTGVRRRRGSFRTIDSLHNPRYRWFFFSMFSGFTATTIQSTAAGWIVFQLTDSFAALGAMQLANGLSSLAMGLAGGVLADRLRQKQRLIQLGQGVSGLAALMVAFTIASGHAPVVFIILASAVFSASHAITMPARQALLPDLVGGERLPNAMGLYTFGQNTAQLLMPGLAGGMIALASPGDGIGGTEYVYALIAAVFLIALLLMTRVPTAPRDARAKRNVFRDIAQGFSYVWRTPTMRMLLSYNVVVALFMMTFNAFMPGYAKEVLDVGAGKFGLLQSCVGGGAVTGSLVVASLPRRRRGLVMLWFVALTATMLAVFSRVTTYEVAVAIGVIVGVGQAGYLSLSNVLLQDFVDQEYRGRVLSIYLMQFGLMAIGVFLAGVVASAVGPQTALAGSGLALLVATIPLVIARRGIRALD